MLRWVGNALAFLGSLAGLVAGYLWWLVAAMPDNVRPDSGRTDLMAIASATKDAAFVTGASAILIAIAEAIRMLRRPRGRESG